MDNIRSFGKPLTGTRLETKIYQILWTICHKFPMGKWTVCQGDSLAVVHLRAVVREAMGAWKQSMFEHRADREKLVLGGGKWTWLIRRANPLPALTAWVNLPQIEFNITLSRLAAQRLIGRLQTCVARAAMAPRFIRVKRLMSSNVFYTAIPKSDSKKI